MYGQCCGLPKVIQIYGLIILSNSTCTEATHHRQFTHGCTAPLAAGKCHHRPQRACLPHTGLTIPKGVGTKHRENAQMCWVNSTTFLRMLNRESKEDRAIPLGHMRKAFKGRWVWNKHVHTMFSATQQRTAEQHGSGQPVSMAQRKVFSLKWIEMLAYTATWMNLEGTVLREASPKN